MARPLPGLAACSRLLVLCLLQVLAAAVLADCAWQEAAAPSPAAAPAPCGWRRALAPPPGGAPQPGPRIIDVSVGLSEATPRFGSSDGLGAGFRELEASQARGDAYTSSLLHLSAHTGAPPALPGGARVPGGGTRAQPHSCPAQLGACIFLACPRACAMRAAPSVQAPTWTAPATSWPRRTPRQTAASTAWTCLP